MEDTHNEEYWSPPGWGRDVEISDGNQSTVDSNLISLPDAFAGHHCPICLGVVTNSSALIEQCGHVFCKGCLLQWLEQSLHCPMCKVEVRGMLYDIKSQREFKVFRPEERTRGKGDTRQLTTLVSVLAEDMDGPGIGGIRAQRQSGGVGSRRVVYSRGLRAQPPDPKARCPKSLVQLNEWIARDVHAAVPRSSSSGVGAQLVLDVVIASLQEYDMEDQKDYCSIKEQLQGFLFEKVDAFLHELWCFKWSSLGMAAYDRNTQYFTPSCSTFDTTV
ncbi:unnamed protein product [Choristocarpus tenellus]